MTTNKEYLEYLDKYHPESIPTLYDVFVTVDDNDAIGHLRAFKGLLYLITHYARTIKHQSIYPPGKENTIFRSML